MYPALAGVLQLFTYADGRMCEQYTRLQQCDQRSAHTHNTHCTNLPSINAQGRPVVGNLIAGIARLIVELPLAAVLLAVFRLGLPAVFWSIGAGHAGAAAAMLVLVYMADWKQAAREVVQVCASLSLA